MPWKAHEIGGIFASQQLEINGIFANHQIAGTLIYRNILLLDLVKQKPVKLGELRRRMNAMALKSDCIDPRQFFSPEMT